MFGGYVYFLFSSLLRPVVKDSGEKMEEKSTKQIIQFSGSDADPTFPVHSRDVEIIAAKGNGTANGESRIKASNVVDYIWEYKFYTGQMLAVHRSGKYIAYGIKGRQSPNAVRVVNRETMQRALLKDAENLIEDLAFAQTIDITLLACVDSVGNLLVYHITEGDQYPSSSPPIVANLILNVLPDEQVKKSIPYRVFWCSYIPEDDFEDDEDDVSKLLAITRYNKVELWNIGTINPNLEPCKNPIKPGSVKDGYLVIEAHDDQITEAVFSPDGTAIATASLDGTCKFYQVYMPPGEAESRCLHQWSPHHGRPVTTLFFLDDLRKFNADVPFWKYAVTGTLDNSELYLWSCETWQRLQRIKFKYPESPDLKFKIGIDLSASVIIISDITNKILYLLELVKDNGENTIPFIAAVTEVRINYSILSFGIVEASIGPYEPKMSPALDQSTNNVNGNGVDEGSELGVTVKMYIIQPKSLQTCDISYPTKRSSTSIPSPPLFDDFANGDCSVFDNGTSTSEEESKTDMTMNNQDETSSQEKVNCIAMTPPAPSLSLMTPEAFAMGVSASDLDGVDSRSVLVAEAAAVSLQAVDPAIVQSFPSLPSSDRVPLDLGPSHSSDDHPQTKSGGSSPSREVEEILAMKNVNSMFSKEELANIPLPQSLAQPQNISHQPHLSSASQPLPQPQARHQQSSQTRSVMVQDKSVGPVVSVAEVQDLKDEIKSLCQLLEKSFHKIQDLETEVRGLKQRESRSDINTEIIGKLIKDSMESHHQRTEKLQGLTMEKMNAMREDTVSHICQLVDNSICTRLPSMIQCQLTNLVNPTIKDLKDTIHKELTIKLSTTDSLLRDNIHKMLKSKALMDTLSGGVAAAGKDAVSQLCRESLTQALPKIEQVCSTMMSDMSDTFSNGTAQYVSEVETQLKRLTEQWHVEMNNLHTGFLQQANAQTLQLIEKSFSELEDRLYKKLSKTMVKAVNSGVTSRVMTPALSSSTQAEIMELVHQGNLPEAFQQALSAADLPLVLSLCEKVPINQIFTPRGCHLPQAVLLSLIQQLSTDPSFTETKHRYLEEAVMNLDSKNEVTKEYMPKILSHLNKQLQLFMANNPTSPYLRRVKMLQMATVSLIH